VQCRSTGAKKAGKGNPILCRPELLMLLAMVIGKLRDMHGWEQNFSLLAAVGFP
jgi:hypothetical protein